MHLYSNSKLFDPIDEEKIDCREGLLIGEKGLIK